MALYPLAPQTFIIALLVWLKFTSKWRTQPDVCQNTRGIIYETGDEGGDDGGDELGRESEIVIVMLVVMKMVEMRSEMMSLEMRVEMMVKVTVIMVGRL